jgi:hypothetical protein
MPPSARSPATPTLPTMSPELLADFAVFLATRGKEPSGPGSGTPTRTARGHPADPPSWDGTRRRLRFRGKAILKFKRRAPRQMAILDALERGGWSTAGVSNPFLGSLDAALAHRRLHETVSNMNRYLADWGLALREDGERVWWQPLG